MYENNENTMTIEENEVEVINTEPEVLDIPDSAMDAAVNMMANSRGSNGLAVAVGAGAILAVGALVTAVTKMYRKRKHYKSADNQKDEEIIYLGFGDRIETLFTGKVRVKKEKEETENTEG